MPIDWNVVPAIGQAILGIGQGLFGRDQRNQAREDLEALNNRTPEIFVPEAVRKMAAEPISAELMNQLSESRARRMAQTTGAVASADPGSVAFTAGQIGDQERSQERSDMAMLDQKRIDALSKLGAAETDVQRRKMDLWKEQVAGARAEMGAGQENIFGGAGEFLRGLSEGVDILGPFGRSNKDNGNIFRELTPEEEEIVNEMGGGVEFKKEDNPWRDIDVDMGLEDVGMEEEDWGPDPAMEQEVKAAMKDPTLMQQIIKILRKSKRASL